MNVSIDYVEKETGMSSSPPSALEKLKAQQAKITARIQQMEARTKVAERKRELRRKILVGAYYLDQANQKNEWDILNKTMDTFLTRNSDRLLFDLPLINESEK